MRGSCGGCFQAVDCPDAQAVAAISIGSLLASGNIRRFCNFLRNDFSHHASAILGSQMRNGFRWCCLVHTCDSAGLYVCWVFAKVDSTHCITNHRVGLDDGLPLRA